MKSLSSGLLPLAFAVAAGLVLPASAQPPAEPKRSQFVFSLLPKSFQKHPSLDFHVITELTAEGKKSPLPTADHPAYYIEQPGKFSQLGNNTPANEHAPDVKELTRAMVKALSDNHYVPATPSTPLPALAVVFNYGSFARFSTASYDFDQAQQIAQMQEQMADTAARSGQTDAMSSIASDGFMRSDEDRDADSLLPIVLAHKQEREDVLQRAALIGGEKFARELADALNQEATYTTGHTALGFGSVDMSSPFHRFANANESTMNLVEESFSGCYFVVASAYDYIAMRKGKRVLLWRTKMTVNSSGVSMSETLPTLVVTAGPYFGREMAEAVTLTRRISREGKVEVGTPRVIGYSEDPATAPPSKNEPAR